MLPVYLVGTLYLSVAVTGNNYCIFDQVQGSLENSLLYVENLPQNLANQPAEFGKMCRGKL